MEADKIITEKEIDGRKVTFVAQTARTTFVPMKKTVEFSLLRLAKLVFLWIGVPVSIMLDGLLTADPTRTLLLFWFYAGLITLFLNAAGFVPIRQHRLVPIKQEEEKGEG